MKSVYASGLCNYFIVHSANKSVSKLNKDKSDFENFLFTLLFIPVNK